LKDLLIVDGYNFIFNFFEAGKMTGGDLENIKTRLAADLAAYNSQKDYDIIVVFDASKSKNDKRSSEVHDDIEVVHSRGGETADSIIEELVSRWSPQRKVVVVTSDYSQQQVILGKNTIRKSSREFGLELETVRRQIKDRIKKTKKKTKKAFYPIEKRLDPDIRKKISDYRKK
jgi:predicted RNA-binding protein with PIN domain